MDLAADITQQDIEMFLQETEEQLQLLDEDIVKLEMEESNSGLLQEIFRAAHTLKGSSAMLGHRRMAEMAHAMENVLDGLRKETLTVNPQLVDALLISLDILRVLKEELVSPRESGTDISAAVAKLEAAMAKDIGPAQAEIQKSERTALALDEQSRVRLEAALATGQSGYRVRVTIDRESSWAAVRCFQILNELSSLGEVVNSVPSEKDIEEEKVGSDLDLLLASHQDEDAIRSAVSSVADIDGVEVSGCRLEDTTTVTEEKKTPSDKPGDKIAAQGTSEMSQTVRVDVSRLDSLMEQVGELVVNRNRINQISKVLEAKYRGDELINDLGMTAVQVAKIVNTLQQDIMTIRMLPIETIFNRFPRMVRDLARQAGKSIDFIIEGQETGVDRSVIEHIRDPLAHLLRNSVDHGSEAPEVRKAAGKPEMGTILLSAYRQENHIVLVIQDDGRGLNPNAIKESAVEKGVISAEVSARLTDAEAIDLMFTSGVSTAKRATEVSGRGVGLDVVKTNIESLNGSIAIDSKPGKGTKFKLMLPLTLAVLPALLISVDHTICAIPLADIVETARLELGDIDTVTGREVTILRGNILPLLRLTTIFGWETEAAGHGDNIFIVVVKAGETQAGLVVDSLIEEQEVVIKSLGGFLGSVKGVTGASILGDGRVALILDVPTLIEMVIAENQQDGRESVCLTS